MLGKGVQISSEASGNTVILPRSASSAAFALELSPAGNERVHACRSTRWNEGVCF